MDKDRKGKGRVVVDQDVQSTIVSKPQKKPRRDLPSKTLSQKSLSKTTTEENHMPPKMRKAWLRKASTDLMGSLISGDRATEAVVIDTGPNTERDEELAEQRKNMDVDDTRVMPPPPIPPIISQHHQQENHTPPSSSSLSRILNPVATRAVSASSHPTTETLSPSLHFSKLSLQSPVVNDSNAHFTSSSFRRTSSSPNPHLIPATSTSILRPSSLPKPKSSSSTPSRLSTISPSPVPPQPESTSAPLSTEKDLPLPVPASHRHHKIHSATAPANQDGDVSEPSMLGEPLKRKHEHEYQPHRSRAPTRTRSTPPPATLPASELFDQPLAPAPQLETQRDGSLIAHPQEVTAEEGNVVVAEGEDSAMEVDGDNLDVPSLEVARDERSSMVVDEPQPLSHPLEEDRSEENMEVELRMDEYHPEEKSEDTTEHVHDVSMEVSIHKDDQWAERMFEEPLKHKMVENIETSRSDDRSEDQVHVSVVREGGETEHSMVPDKHAEEPERLQAPTIPDPEPEPVAIPTVVEPAPPPKVKLSLKDFALRKKKQREEEQSKTSSPAVATRSLESDAHPSPLVDAQKENVPLLSPDHISAIASPITETTPSSTPAPLDSTSASATTDVMRLKISTTEPFSPSSTMPITIPDPSVSVVAVPPSSFQPAPTCDDVKIGIPPPPAESTLVESTLVESQTPVADTLAKRTCSPFLPNGFSSSVPKPSSLSHLSALDQSLIQPSDPSSTILRAVTPPPKLSTVREEVVSTSTVQPKSQLARLPPSPDLDVLEYVLRDTSDSGDIAGDLSLDKTQRSSEDHRDVEPIPPPPTKAEIIERSLHDNDSYERPRTSSESGYTPRSNGYTSYDRDRDRSPRRSSFTPPSTAFLSRQYSREDGEILSPPPPKPLPLGPRLYTPPTHPRSFHPQSSPPLSSSLSRRPPLQSTPHRPTALPQSSPPSAGRPPPAAPRALRASNYPPSQPRSSPGGGPPHMAPRGPSADRDRLDPRDRERSYSSSSRGRGRPSGWTR
ncbi:hypothetical protein C8Q75DRAFT_486449 [Abortiporus biennis]|nr:hypothetical protein C8Q75DRAFT_486449 [Abortiporus biennis]